MAAAGTRRLRQGDQGHRHPGVAEQGRGARRHQEHADTMTSTATGVLARIRASIKPEWREGGYRVVTGAIMLLFALGVMEKEEAALWTQLGISVITTLFAIVFATSGWRTALY